MERLPGSRAASGSWSACGASSITGRELVAGQGRADGQRAATGGDYSDAERALRRKTHDTIRRVTVDIEERMHLNTAVSSLMELVNELYAFSERHAARHPVAAARRRPAPVERAADAGGRCARRSTRSS